MKLLSDTLAVLKNFSNINSGIVISPGNVLVTVAESGAICGRATIKDTFEKEICVYNLSEFLQLIDLLDEPELNVTEDDVILSSGRKKITYQLASKESISTIPVDQQIPEVDPIASFVLSEIEIKKMFKFAQSMKFDDILFTAENGELEVKVFDKEKPEFSTYVLKIEGVIPKKDFKIFLKKSQLKIVDADYKVDITSMFVLFEAQELNLDLSYWVALDPNSVVE